MKSKPSSILAVWAAASLWVKVLSDLHSTRPLFFLSSFPIFWCQTLQERWDSCRLLHSPSPQPPPSVFLLLISLSARPPPPTFPVLSSMLRACSALLFPFYLTDRKLTPRGFLFLSFTSWGWSLLLKKNKNWGNPHCSETFAWLPPGDIQIYMQDYYKKVPRALRGGCPLAFWTRGRMINQVYNQARAVSPMKSTLL